MFVDSSKTYIGIVEENLDPKKLGRCRVRVIDIFDDIPTEDIPWATPWKDLNGNSNNIPEKGKIVTVIFDSGNIYKPEFIYSDHFNVNLEQKLQKLSDSDYKSMKSLLFDHKTQIYVNDSEGLKIDYKYNNINIKESTINLNLKDNLSLLNLGDEIAEQQAILGNHWMDWFDLFVDNLLGNKGGPYIDARGYQIGIPSPSFVAVLESYKRLRNPVFLSKHVNIVDNNQVHTVRITERENNPQLGDDWKSTKESNTLSTYDNSGNFEPSDSIVRDDLPDDPTYVAPSTDGTSDESYELAEDTNPPLSSPESNQEVEKMIRFLQSKRYTVYDKIGVLNMVGMRNPKKDDGTVTNKFDDKLFVFYKNEKGNWVLLKYDITVVPGYNKNSSILGMNRAILQLGQYIDQYTIGFHQGKKDHKCLKHATSVVHRNDKTTKYNYQSKTEKGSFGINIHRSGKPQGNNVYNWSEGCQVFKLYSAWEQFINLCDRQISLSGKKTFTYTLIKQSEFDSFI